MDMMEQLSRIGIVPVIAINDAADAVPLVASFTPVSSSVIEMPSACASARTLTQ